MSRVHRIRWHGLAVEVQRLPGFPTGNIPVHRALECPAANNARVVTYGSLRDELKMLEAEITRSIAVRQALAMGYNGDGSITAGWHARMQGKV